MAGGVSPPATHGIVRDKGTSDGRARAGCSRPSSFFAGPGAGPAPLTERCASTPLDLAHALAVRDADTRPLVAKVLDGYEHAQGDLLAARVALADLTR
ncbi:hypothetical protein [Nonomuraea sp. NPDC049784]|uniref:hypothetical protein n=1 Tax=Nonomuraea sp. NPDC049784 TaxID=3154361 RepID=UPI0033E37232